MKNLLTVLMLMVAAAAQAQNGPKGRRWAPRAEAAPAAKAEAKLKDLDLDAADARRRADLRLESARVLAAAGRYEEAFAEVRSVLASEPENRAAWQLLGALGEKTGDEQAARSAWTAEPQTASAL